MTKVKDPGRREYFREYNKKSRVRISLNLSKDTDRDILESIDKEDPRNKQAAVKSLIRKSFTSGKL